MRVAERVADGIAVAALRRRRVVELIERRFDFGTAVVDSLPHAVAGIRGLAVRKADRGRCVVKQHVLRRYERDLFVGVYVADRVFVKVGAAHLHKHVEAFEICEIHRAEPVTESGIGGLPDPRVRQLQGRTVVRLVRRLIQRMAAGTGKAHDLIADIAFMHAGRDRAYAGQPGIFKTDVRQLDKLRELGDPFARRAYGVAAVALCVAGIPVGVIRRLRNRGGVQRLPVGGVVVRIFRNGFRLGLR